MMIVGTTGASAVRAGFEALKQGGSAVDAALTTALTQIALAGGGWVSYAGLFTMVVYEAESGKVHSLSAGFGIPRGEIDPATIPAQGSGTPSGRTALVPGFMAGVGAAHERFGKLPLASVFGPAIYYAEEGFELSPMTAGMIVSRKTYLHRLPATRKIFFGAGDAGGASSVEAVDREPHPAGYRFRQPELATTLKAVVEHGTDYMYKGAWAEHFVAAVNQEGGNFTRADLADYQAIWAEPVRTQYLGFDVAALGSPSMGGVNSVECLNLLEAAALEPYTQSAESLFWWMQITNAFVIGYLPPAMQDFLFPGVEVSPGRRASKEWAKTLWGKLKDGSFPMTRKPPAGNHSDAVVAIDSAGNVVALVHSINTTLWGESGIFVDGVSIPDAASYQQDQIAAAGPGDHLPDPTNPLIVLRDGKPVLASSSIGGGLHQQTMMCLDHVLRGMTPAEAIAQPTLLLPKFGALGLSTAQVPEGAFADEMIDQVRALGQPVTEANTSQQGATRGYWIGIHVDPKTGKLSGGFPAGLGGGAIGH